MSECSAGMRSSPLTDRAEHRAPSGTYAPHSSRPNSGTLERAASMQAATVRFTDQRVVFDRVTRRPFHVRIAGEFVGYGVDPHEVPTMQQWLVQAAFHALDRFQQPLAELPKQQQFWSAEVTNLVNPVFHQHFRAQGSVQILSVEVLPATSHASMAPVTAPAQTPLAPAANFVVPQAAPAAPVAAVAVAAPAPAPVVAPPAVLAAPPPPPPVEEPIATGPAVELDPWEIELRALVDPPTSVSVKPVAVIAYRGAAISEKRIEGAQKLAAECVADAIAKECEQGRSVLDLLLFASALSSSANERFEREIPDRARARGTIAVRDIRLSQEDAERLRDLYGQIAAARGG